MSFGFHPQHIATLGHLDGQYGIGTIGYLILPDIVPRFAARALVHELDLVGETTSLNLTGSIGDDMSQTLVGLIDPDKPPSCC
jgi:hypothetical protein